MEKISGIIPNSARLASVDMREAAPVRPGTPRFGRPEGVSSLKKPELPVAPTTPDQMMNFGQSASKAVGIHQTQMTWRTKEAEQARIASEMSNRFFMKNERAAEAVVDHDQPGVTMSMSPVVSRPTGFNSNARPVPIAETTGQEDPIVLEQPEGLFPKGSFIDRTA